jgi:hypothetical protein
MRLLSHLENRRWPRLRGDALPRREREIMNALFALSNRATAEEFRARLADPPTGSSVRVMLARLEKKGYLRHSEEGVRYVYSATESPDKAKRHNPCLLSTRSNGLPRTRPNAGISTVLSRV